MSHCLQDRVALYTAAAQNYLSRDQPLAVIAHLCQQMNQCVTVYVTL